MGKCRRIRIQRIKEINSICSTDGCRDSSKGSCTTWFDIS